MFVFLIKKKDIIWGTSTSTSTEINKINTRLFIK